MDKLNRITALLGNACYQCFSFVGTQKSHPKQDTPQKQEH